MAGYAERLAVIERVMADPPVVHYLTYEDLQSRRLTGVHSTEGACYRFLATMCERGSRTLETGAGISTVLFAAWGCEHRCVTPAQVEVDALVAYCREHCVPTDSVRFEVGPSEVVLARDDPGEPPLDVVFVDGGHGFPIPMIDWFYGAARLRKGGVLVIDDVHLPAVKILRSFLDLDPRWDRLERTSKWAAYERLGEGPLGEDWYDQPFYRMPGSRLRPVGPWEDRARRVARPVRSALSRRFGR
jgi:predicted O-methyltransferase YrrM